MLKERIQRVLKKEPKATIFCSTEIDDIEVFSDGVAEKYEPVSLTTERSKGAWGTTTWYCVLFKRKY